MSAEEEVRDIEREVIGESSVDGPSLQPAEVRNPPGREGDNTTDGTEVDPVVDSQLGMSQSERSAEDRGEEVRSEDQAPDTAKAGECEHGHDGGGSDVDEMSSENRMEKEDKDGTTDDSQVKQEEVSSDVVDDESEKVEAREDAESGELQDDPHQIEPSKDETKAKRKGASSKTTVEDNDEEVDVGDLSQLTEDSRNILFGRGLVYERAGKKSCALKCYLACLSHLTPQSNFVLLPQCLRNIADLYYRKEQYEKAILFIQAEKLFYENALIDTSEVQQKIEALQEGMESSNVTRSSEDAKQAADSLRADEYEHLAKLCVDKKQPQLALEYAGKATKLRQKIYGNDNPITKESLDFFATLYAEVGKQQYTDSMSHLSEPGEDEGESVSPPITPSMERSPSSILRQRKTGESESDKKKQVRFQEPEGTGTSSGTDSSRENEEFISHTLLWILFVICFVMLCILGVWLYCTLCDSLMCSQALFSQRKFAQLDRLLAGYCFVPAVNHRYVTYGICQGQTEAYTTVQK